MEYIEIPLGRAKDLSKKKYGKWQPLYRIKSPAGRGTYWLCQCSCYGPDSLRPVDAASLTTGRSTSCGCNIDQSDRNSKYYNGQKVGHWTILSYEGSNKYKCQCDCEFHTVEIRRSNRITESNSCKRCGTNHLIDLTGEKFGHWTVLSRGEGSSSGHTYWLCECDCANHTKRNIDGYKLKNGISTSCGCDKKSQGEKAIEFLLTKEKISFVREKTFKEFIGKNNNFYRFDFYVEDKYIIEYDGI